MSDLFELFIREFNKILTLDCGTLGQSTGKIDVII